MVLDKLRHVHRFFQGLEKVSDAVGDVSQASFFPSFRQLTMHVDASVYQDRLYCNSFTIQSKASVDVITIVALIFPQQLCEKQKEIRDAARDLVNEMDSLLKSGMEDLGGMLGTNPSTKVAFRSLADTIAEIFKFIEEHRQGIVDGLLRKLL